MRKVVKHTFFKESDVAQVVVPLLVTTLVYYARKYAIYLGGYEEMNLKILNIDKFTAEFVYIPAGWFFGVLIWGLLIRNYGLSFVAKYLSFLAVYYLFLSIYATKSNSFSSSEVDKDVKQ